MGVNYKTEEGKFHPQIG